MARRILLGIFILARTKRMKLLDSEGKAAAWSKEKTAASLLSLMAKLAALHSRSMILSVRDRPRTPPP
eukprot:15229640-Alexandrium_andersonii.AAC.1